jgi:DNA polymerase III subunit delta
MNSPGAYVYVLYGEDGFSRDEALQSLKERMRSLPAGEHNLTELSGAQATVDELRAAADVVPFLAERRMVIVRGLLARLQGRGGGPVRRTRSKAKAPTAEYDEYQALLDYLPDVPPTTSVAFIEDGPVDAETIKAAIPAGRAFVRAFPRVEDVAGWVRRRAQALEVELDETAVRELALLGGDDLRRLDTEIRKLGAYAADRTVTRADVRELVVGRDLSVWALLDALTERRPDRALRALRGLYARGEAPEALVARDMGPLYRRLLVAKELSLADRNLRSQIDVAALGLNPRTLPRLTEQAERFERDELEHALELLLDVDRQMKTGEAQPETAVELLVTRLTTRLNSADRGAWRPRRSP